MKNMYVLGIETSCDETGASIVYNGSKIYSNVTATSLKAHSQYGGVIPEIASRAQLEYINPVVHQALKDAGKEIKDIGLVSVTKGPGLIGSLLVGISFAKAFSYANNIPILGLDHVQSHIYAAFLDSKVIPKFPFVGLVVSGGHTTLFYFKNFNNSKIISQTLDDAAGEAFDKVAKLLNLGYPGGPLIEKIAKEGNSKAYNFKCNDGSPNFSFSGIKTAVLYKVNEINKDRALTKKDKCDLAASFQRSVVESLVNKSISAVVRKGLDTLVVGGGVAANGYFRSRLQEESKLKKIKLFIAKGQFCTDNASMVAGLGYQLYKLGKRDDLRFKPILY